MLQQEIHINQGLKSIEDFFRERKTWSETLSPEQA